jgi:branched-chain amino acid transport system ATP-binding protein
MLAIARSLMSGPKLLLCDELSLGLAPIVVEKIYSEIIEELKTLGLTVLLVEQNVPLALSVADRAYVLENGKVMMEGKSSDLLNSDNVKKAYLGI